MKGQFTGPCDWEAIAAVRKRVNIPLIANGGIQTFQDVERCLAATGANAVMSSEALLEYPALFSNDTRCIYQDELALEYLELAKLYQTPHKQIKAHMFHFLYAGLQLHTDLRSRFGEAKGWEQINDTALAFQERRRRDRETGVAWPDKGWYLCRAWIIKRYREVGTASMRRRRERCAGEEVVDVVDVGEEQPERVTRYLAYLHVEESLVRLLMLTEAARGTIGPGNAGPEHQGTAPLRAAAAPAAGPACCDRHAGSRADERMEGQGVRSELAERLEGCWHHKRSNGRLQWDILSDKDVDIETEAACEEEEEDAWKVDQAGGGGIWSAGFSLLGADKAPGFTCEGFLLMENEDTFDGLLETIEKRKDSVLLRVIFNEGLQKSSLITSLQSANSSLQTRFQKGLKLAALCERARDSSPAECIACIQEALALNITIEDKGCMTGPHDFTCFVQC
ncbi:unnamed protein product [Durusdinium trenchii]|uniref:DUS-like FMN-binding domain-containing protein n=1 Tax=Durusdinium trenchii TaxID=1381693 RepID=A0ABP0II94_9DINO